MLEKLFDEKDPLAEQIAKLTKLAEDKVRELDETTSTDGHSGEASAGGDAAAGGSSCGCCSH